jgi:hypothetical protein
MPDFGVTLTISAEERQDRWGVWVEELAFFAYGETADEAEKRVGDMLAAIATSFNDEPGGFETYLKERGVQYEVLDEPVVSGASRPHGVLGRLPPAFPRPHVVTRSEVSNALAV